MTRILLFLLLTGVTTSMRGAGVTLITPEGGIGFCKTESGRGPRTWSPRWWAEGKVRATDAKEVGVENPAEETFRCPNQSNVTPTTRPVKG